MWQREESDCRQDVHQLEDRRDDHQQVKVLRCFFNWSILCWKLERGIYLISVQIAEWPPTSQERLFSWYLGIYQTKNSPEKATMQATFPAAPKQPTINWKIEMRLSLNVALAVTSIIPSTAKENMELVEKRRISWLAERFILLTGSRLESRDWRLHFYTRLLSLSHSLSSFFQEDWALQWRNILKDLFKSYSVWNIFNFR